jgi:ferritin-like metal-binding protein YciE
MPDRKLADLFLTTLRDIYSGEQQMLTALPRMARAAEDEELKGAFEDHVEVTQQQVRRLDQVFALLSRSPDSEMCEAIAGLVSEGEDVIAQAEEGAVCDAGLIAAGQAVEHYEIARYGTLVAWAKQLGLEEAADLLAETLEEEKNADETLNRIALTSSNRQAA